MQRIGIVTIIAGSVMVSSCGNTTVKTGKDLESKKKELVALKGEQEALAKKVDEMEKEIAKLDTTAVAEKTKLVSLQQLEPVSFTHYIDLQGKVDAENISYVAPRGTPGVARAIYVKKGDVVSKGKLLLKMDDALVRTQIASAQTQLAYAKDIYQRRKNLWDQKIGAEIDLITAQNNVDQVLNQIKLLQEQLGFTNVYADQGGVIDDITVRVGETFMGGNQIRIVNTSQLKAVVQVPEVYQDRVKIGSPVTITLPELGRKTIQGRVKVAGKLIDPQTRSFYIEVQLPSDKDLRPNQIALAQIEDYAASNVVTIPVNTLQTDDKGKFVYVASTEKNKMVARKRAVEIGQMYNDKIEVKSGLQPGDMLITDGFQTLYEGQPITTQ